MLLLSSFDQPPLVRTAFERGAAGYLLKTSELPEILDAIRTIATGGTMFSAAMLRTIRTAPRRPSDREVEVLTLVCAGATNDEIGGRLGVSDKTVESHLRRLFDRYGVLSRTELAVWRCARDGWRRRAGRDRLVARPRPAASSWRPWRPRCCHRRHRAAADPDRRAGPTVSAVVRCCGAQARHRAGADADGHPPWPGGRDVGATAATLSVIGVGRRSARSRSSRAVAGLTMFAALVAPAAIAGA